MNDGSERKRWTNEIRQTRRTMIDYGFMKDKRIHRT